MSKNNLFDQLCENSGDVDGRVPVTASQYAIEALKVSVVTPWQPWFRDWEVSNQCMNFLSSLIL